jgi:hypothetical protein
VLALKVIRKRTDKTYLRSRGLVGVVDYSLEVAEDFTFSEEWTILFVQNIEPVFTKKDESQPG